MLEQLLGWWGRVAPPQWQVVTLAKDSYHPIHPLSPCSWSFLSH